MLGCPVFIVPTRTNKFPVQHRFHTRSTVNKPTVARRYARSLFGLVDASTVEAIRTGLAALGRASLDSPQLKHVLASPAFGFEEKMAVLSALNRKLECPPTVEPFLAQLIRKNRIGLLPEIAEAFSRIADEARGRRQITVASARPLPEPEQQELRKRLREVLRQDIELAFHTQPDLIGGLRVQIGSMVFDSTLRGRLRTLQTLLTKE